MNNQIQHTGELNTPFDQLQWEDSKLNGCQPAPCLEYPSWPPPPEVGFIYPSLSKVTQPTLLGQNLGPGTESTPYVENTPQNETNPWDAYSDKVYSPEDILNMNDCNVPTSFTPPALPGTLHGPTPLQNIKGAPMYVRQIEGNWIPFNPDYTGRLRENMVSGPPNQDTQLKKKAPLPTGMVGASVPGGNVADYAPSPSSTDCNINIVDIDVYTKGIPTDPRCLRYNLRHLFPCMAHSLRGVMYDLAFWDDLPCGRQSKLVWILSREDRMFYIATLVLIIMVVYVLLSVLFHHLKISQYFKFAVVVSLIAFLLYFLTPPACEENQLMKGFAVAVLVMIVVVLYYTFKK